jgi:hypothetical protein
VPLRHRSSSPSSAPARLSAALLPALANRVRPAPLAAGRAGIGAVMIARPRALPGAFGVDSATSARMSWAVQMLGAREVAVGLGTLASLRGGDRRATRTWVAAGIVCDAVDALVMASALARRRVAGPAGAAALVIALAATAGGVQALGEDPDAPLS